MRRVRFFFFFSSRRRHTRSDRDWSSDVCSSDLPLAAPFADRGAGCPRDADPAAAGGPADAAGKIGARAAGLADRPGLGDRGDATAVPALRAGLPAPRVAVPA